MSGICDKIMLGKVRLAWSLKGVTWKAKEARNVTKMLHFLFDVTRDSSTTL